jgi:hypothetical protein
VLFVAGDVSSAHRDAQRQQRKAIPMPSFLAKSPFLLDFRELQFAAREIVHFATTRILELAFF